MVVGEEEKGDLNLSPPVITFTTAPKKALAWMLCHDLCEIFFLFFFSEMDVGSDMLGEGSVTMEEEEEGIDSLLFLPFDIFSGPHD